VSNTARAWTTVAGFGVGARAVADVSLKPLQPATPACPNGRAVGFYGFVGGGLAALARDAWRSRAAISSF
jgi:hypothetical protein